MLHPIGGHFLFGLVLFTSLFVVAPKGALADTGPDSEPPLLNITCSKTYRSNPAEPGAKPDPGFPQPGAVTSLCCYDKVQEVTRRLRNGCVHHYVLETHTCVWTWDGTQESMDSFVQDYIACAS